MQRKQWNKTKQWLSFILCLVLIAAMAFGTTGCKEKPVEMTAVMEDGIIGEGEQMFRLTVAVKGEETVFDVYTNKETVGEALQELGLIAGEKGPYGLYVKTVNGITLDYDKDGWYWAFYQDGVYATSGVDKTKIIQGVTYTFQAEQS